MDWLPLLHFEWQSNARVSRETVRGQDTKSSHFLSLQLAPASPSTCHSRVTSTDIPSVEKLVAGCYGFHCSVMRACCIIIIMAKSSPSISIPPKALACADISFGSRHLKCGQNCSNSLGTLRYSGRGRGGRQPEVKGSILGTN